MQISSKYKKDNTFIKYKYKYDKKIYIPKPLSNIDI